MKTPEEKNEAKRAASQEEQVMQAWGPGEEGGDC